MNLKITFILCFILISTSYAQVNPEEVLFNRKASFEDRENVKELLNQSLGRLKPLPFKDALAEICYGVDICAEKETDDQLNTNCFPGDDDEEYSNQLGNACHVKDIRANYTCSAENDFQGIPRVNLSTLELAGSLLSDLGSLYSNQTREVILDGINEYTIKELNIDFKKIAYNNTEREAFFLKYPKLETWFMSLFQNNFALGAYTGNCYHELNTILFSNDSKKITRFFNLYSSIINTLNVFPKNFSKVNRGVNLPVKALEEHHKIGNIICYNGFTSTAVHDEATDRGDHPRNYFLEGKCVQRLYIDTIDNGAEPGKLISSASMSQSENEVLFEPGACFRIDKVYARTDSDGLDQDSVCSEGERFNFEMTLVPNPNY